MNKPQLHIFYHIFLHIAIQEKEIMRERKIVAPECNDLSTIYIYIMYFETINFLMISNLANEAFFERTQTYFKVILQ